MRVQAITALSALAGSVQGVRILQSNDDGWAELYIRSLHESLKGAGHDVVLSAPAENKSGSSKCMHAVDTVQVVTIFAHLHIKQRALCTTSQNANGLD